MIACHVIQSGEQVPVKARSLLREVTEPEVLISSQKLLSNRTYLLAGLRPEYS